jgi:hypothetical protein
MFLLLVPIGLALLVFSVLGLAGFGPITDERRADRDGLLGAVGPAVGLLAGIGIIALAVVGSVVLGGVPSGEEGDRDGDDRAGAPAVVATTTTNAESTATTLPRRRAAPAVPGLGPKVAIDGDRGESFPELYDVVDNLERATVLQVTAHGFESFERGIAEQCAPALSPQCFNQIPVQFDEDGVARIQFLATLDFLSGSPPAGRCRAGTAPCMFVVRSIEGDRSGQLQTVFGMAAPPPGRVTVTKADGLSLDGETVTVTVRNYPPGARVRAMLCAAPEATLDRCGRPGPQAPLVVGRDGTGSTELRIEPGPVGAVQASCTRGSDCGIAVASRHVFSRAPVVPISFAGRGGATYDPTRLALGLAIAALLIGIAAWLILRTDWSAVGEAAAPEIDDAEYADLDAIIAALPPEEEDELVTTR